jgi:hypothetical protein
MSAAGDPSHRGDSAYPPTPSALPSSFSLSTCTYLSVCVSSDPHSAFEIGLFNNMQLAGECIVVFLGRISSIEESRSSMETGRSLQAEHGDNWHSEDQGLHFLVEFCVFCSCAFAEIMFRRSRKSYTARRTRTHHTSHRLR